MAFVGNVGVRERFPPPASVPVLEARRRQTEAEVAREQRHRLRGKVVEAPLPGHMVPKQAKRAGW